MMQEELIGKVYDIQGFSVQDGPGIRTTVFLKGCPLRCPWCHSPESQAFHSQLSWISMKCLGTEACGQCLGVCPKGALSEGGTITKPGSDQTIRLVRIDRELCDNCGLCADVCRPKALYICGTDYTVPELVEKLSLDKPFFDQSGGGVTISGGEALSQHRFTEAVLKGLKARDIHTAVDTTGFTRESHIDAVLPHIDLFLYDLKHMDSRLHEQMVGVPNGIILENARRIARASGKLQVRIPVIPMFNDTEENIRETGRFCSSIREAVTVVQLLPYHSMGVMKHERISEGETVFEATPPSDEKIAYLKAILEGYDLEVTVH